MYHLGPRGVHCGDISTNTVWIQVGYRIIDLVKLMADRIFLAERFVKVDYKRIRGIQYVFL